MIRILHIISSLDWGGAQRQLQLLAEGLPRDEHDIHVCALGRGGPMLQPFRAAGVPTQVIGRRWSADPLAFALLQTHIRRLRPDVVHLWDGECRAFGLAAARSAGVPHAVASERYVGGAGGEAGSGRSALSRRMARRIDRIIVNHELVRGHWTERGLPGERFTVIPQGVPAAPPGDVSREELFAELALPPEARLVGAVGRLAPRKRVKELIWAADLVRVLHDNIRLLLIGDGPQRRHLEQFARGASDLDHIRFLGGRADLWRILPHLEVFWHASGNEGQSLAVMEAMAAGVSVVVSDTPGNRSLVNSGETGYLAPIAGRAVRARCTDRLFRDEALRRRVGEAGRRHVTAQYPAARMLDDYSGLYRTVAAGGSVQKAKERAA